MSTTEQSKPPAPLAPNQIQPSIQPALSAPLSGQTCSRSDTPEYTGGVIEPCSYCISHYIAGNPNKYCLTYGMYGEKTYTIYDNANTTGDFLGCPAGYKYENSVCNLISPRLAVPDRKCDLLLNAGQFSVAADADCPTTYDSSRLTPLIRNGRVIAYGRGSNGQPLLFDVRATTTYIEVAATRQNTPVETGGATTLVTDVSRFAIGSGQLISASSSQQAGYIQAPTGSSVPASSVSPNATNTPSIVTSSGVTSAGVSGGNDYSVPTNQMPTTTTFPSDYARQGEAQTAANTLKPELEGIKDRLTNSENIEDPTPGQWVDPWGNAFDALKGWQLPNHASQCPTGSFNWPWSNQVMTIDSHCQLANDHLSIVSAVMFAVWSILALRVVLKA